MSRQQFKIGAVPHTDRHAYCSQKKILVKALLKKSYCSEENCLHISSEAGILKKRDLLKKSATTARWSLGLAHSAMPFYFIE